MAALSRRTFVKQSSLLAASATLAVAIPQEVVASAAEKAGPKLRWLGDDEVPAIMQGATWGVPWPKGSWRKDTPFSLKDDQGKEVVADTWPLAFWPDGSLKWTAHAMGKQQQAAKGYQVVPNRKGINPTGISVHESAHVVKIDTGTLQASFAKKGQVILQSLSKQAKVLGNSGQMVLRLQGDPDDPQATVSTSFGEVASVRIEQQGKQRVTVKVEGEHHLADGRTAFPFILRFYFYKDAESIKLVHTFIFDGDEQQDFIAGLGFQLKAPLEGELHDRHVRFVGEGDGLFAEAVRGLTGLRRDPGKTIVEAQLAGKATPLLDEFPENVRAGLPYIPAFGDYTLYQATSSSFFIEKRTKPGHAWIKAGTGGRAAGTAYLGSHKGGIAFGIRNFWQSYPAQLDIRNAHTDEATLTSWLWAPKSDAMDLRFYHDGMGQDTYTKQLDALDITYEDYEPGFGTPQGVARTSELQLWVLEATPPREALLAIGHHNQDPPTLSAEPPYLKAMEVFGGAFALPENDRSRFRQQEDQLAFVFDYYIRQREMHDWFGFWDFGDVMHTYDGDRHVWRYDVGGFAWDNSELSTDLWLWYYFLRTGRKDVFRMAEAMTRHTGEVDVHHVGPFSPLGSRHNVQHWGCSAKQLRISTAANRRIYYYLTADERVGDLLTEQVEAVQTVRRIVPGRKIGQQAADAADHVRLSFGTDWGAVAAAWFTEWERSGNRAIGERLLNSMRTIALQPHGFFTGIGEMAISTGKFKIDQDGAIQVSHLNASFGLPEICYELLQSVDLPEFKNAWLTYCKLYNASEDEQQQHLGKSLGKLNLRQGHARLTAYAAKETKDVQLLDRAVYELEEGSGGMLLDELQTTRVEGPDVLQPVEENNKISTNAVAQWALAAMQLQAFSAFRATDKP